jgi:hypothetical protein
LCRHKGLTIAPSASKEELMYALVFGTDDLPLELRFNQFDEWRHALAGFVLSRWRQLQNQLTCPLKNKDPLACFSCLDSQVATCIVSNPANEHEIERFKHAPNDGNS